MPLKTDLNVSPYFDDFDSRKNYHRILFRPGTAIQARELTQSQSILQDQIEKLGNYMFKNGDIVSGCSVSDLPNLQYARLRDFDTSNNVYSVANLVGLIVKSPTSNLQARVVYSLNGAEDNYPNTSAIYFSYMNTGLNGEMVFSNNETLNFYYANDVLNSLYSINTYSNSTINTFSTGVAHGVKVTPGVVFISGNFVEITEPVIGLVNNFGTYTANSVVGFAVDEEIITEYIDDTLLDNALGYPNENAPGAHRLKISADLIALDPLVASNTPGFNSIASYNYGALVQTQRPSDQIQSLLGEAIANRTYEESGNYVVNPFLVDSVSTPSSISTNNDPNYFYARVGPGVGYVKGQRVENRQTAYVRMRKGTDTETVLRQQININYGGYLKLLEVSGAFPFTSGQTVNLYDAPQYSVSSRQFSNVPISGNLIGTATVRNFSNIDGPVIHLFNIKMNSKYSFNQVKSIYYDGPQKGVADVNYYSGSPSFGMSYQLFPVGSPAIKNLKNASGNNDSRFIYRKSSNTVISTSGNASVTITTSITGGVDTLPYGQGILSDQDAANFIVVIQSQGETANLAGTVEVFSDGPAVYGTSTTFLNDFMVNELIQVGSEIRLVTEIVNNSFMWVDSVWSANSNLNGYKKKFLPGQILAIDSNAPGSRYVQVNSQTNFVVRAGFSPTTPLNCTIFYDILRNSVVPAKKQIRKNRFVKIDTSSNPKGPWCLGFSDVHKINDIWGTSNGVYTTLGAEISPLFLLDSGQKDDMYGLSYLSLSPGSPSNLYTNLLVNLDYFISNTTTGVGFHTVESYPVDDSQVSNTRTITTAEIPLYVDSYGKKLPLRDYIDFRPVSVPTANDTGYIDVSNATQVSSGITAASLNPSSNVSFDIPINGFIIPSYGSKFETNYTYYLPRKDVIFFTPQNVLKSKEGASSLNPQTPLYPDNGMVLSVLNIPPYPSITSDLVDQYTRINSQTKTLSRDVFSTVTSKLVMHRRYTMADIGKIDNRVKDLEYYASLTLLQQKATDLTVTDLNGLDRFKNGIFAEPFSDFSFSDVSNPEYKIAIDQAIGVARPRVKREYIATEFNSSNSVAIQKTGRVLTLPYTSVPFITQNYASRFRTCAPDIWLWNGTLTLFPSYEIRTDYTNIGSTTVTVDLTSSFAQFANSVDGSFYGAWRTVPSVTTTSTNNPAPNGNTSPISTQMTGGSGGFGSFGVNFTSSAHNSPINFNYATVQANAFSVVNNTPIVEANVNSKTVYSNPINNSLYNKVTHGPLQTPARYPGYDGNVSYALEGLPSSLIGGGYYGDPNAKITQVYYKGNLYNYGRVIKRTRSQGSNEVKYEYIGNGFIDVYWNGKIDTNVVGGGPPVLGVPNDPSFRWIGEPY